QVLRVVGHALDDRAPHLHRDDPRGARHVADGAPVAGRQRVAQALDADGVQRAVVLVARRAGQEVADRPRLAARHVGVDPRRVAPGPALLLPELVDPVDRARARRADLDAVGQAARRAERDVVALLLDHLDQLALRGAADVAVRLGRRRAHLGAGILDQGLERALGGAVLGARHLAPG